MLSANYVEQGAILAKPVGHDRPCATVALWAFLMVQRRGIVPRPGDVGFKRLNWVELTGCGLGLPAASNQLRGRVRQASSRPVEFWCAAEWIFVLSESW
jgi:hypothetical protein